MEERFVELYGLQKYTHYIKKFPIRPFEDIIEMALYEHTEVLRTDGPSLVSIVIGNKRFCFLAPTESYGIPLGTNIKIVSWPAPPKTADNVFDLIRNYLLTGKVNPQNIIYEKMFHKLEDYRYIGKVLSSVSETRFEKPSGRAEGKLNKIGLFYNQHIGVWRTEQPPSSNKLPESKVFSN